MEDVMQFGLREMIFTSLLLGMVAGTYATIVQPHARARTQRTAEMRGMDTTLSKISGSAGDFDAVARHVDQQRQAATLFDSRLPRACDIQKSIDEVMQAAAANSLQAGEAQLLQREDNNGIECQPVKLELTGNFNGFYSFLLQLESMPHASRVAGLALRGGEQHDGQIQADLTVKMYFAPDKSTARAG
jgi:type IV pilus assembly protein PilO